MSLLTNLGVAGVESVSTTARFWQSDGTPNGTIDIEAAVNTFAGGGYAEGQNFTTFDEGAIAIDLTINRVYIVVRNKTDRGVWPGGDHEGQCCILVCDENGVIQTIIFPGDHDEFSAGIYTICVPASGKLWIATETLDDPEIWEYDSDGGFVREVGTITGADASIEPAYGTELYQGFLYFPTLAFPTDKGGVFKFDKVGGSDSTRVLAADQAVDRINGMALMRSTGDLFLRQSGPTTRRFSSAGALLQSYEITGASSASGMAVDRDGLHFYAGGYVAGGGGGPRIYRVLIADGSITAIIDAEDPDSGDYCNSALAQIYEFSLSCPTGTGTIHIPYASALVAVGGEPPYTYEIQAGALPDGLVLNAATGAITGTPTTVGIFSFTARVTDAEDATVDHTCVIRVNGPCSIWSLLGLDIAYQVLPGLQRGDPD